MTNGTPAQEGREAHGQGLMYPQSLSLCGDHALLSQSLVKGACEHTRPAQAFEPVRRRSLRYATHPDAVPGQPVRHRQ